MSDSASRTPVDPVHVRVQKEPPANSKDELQEFCVRCFASSVDGSWDHVVQSGYCTNCGGGQCLSVPRWAIEQVRSNASRVGKRYYPAKEDGEVYRELAYLRSVAPGHVIGAEENTFEGRTTYQAYVHLPNGCRSSVGPFNSAAEALERGRQKLPYPVPEEFKPL